MTNVTQRLPAFAIANGCFIHQASSDITCFFIGFNLQEALYALVLKWYAVLLIRAIIDYVLS